MSANWCRDEDTGLGDRRVFRDFGGLLALAKDHDAKRDSGDGADNLRGNSAGE